MNIYLDIDGVLLANEREAARHADLFIQTAINAYPDSTYWLTTHVWRNEHRVNQVLAPYLRPETVALLNKVRPTIWGDFKTDALDFSTDFLWFDDDLWPEEKKVLEDNNALNKLVMVDLSEDPDKLFELAKYIIDHKENK